MNSLQIRQGEIKLVLMPYLDHIEDALAEADLAVCRAGAGTLSELAILVYRPFWYPILTPATIIRKRMPGPCWKKCCGDDYR